MNALPLSALHPTTRARLESLAVEWLGFDPWDACDSDGGRYGAWESRVPGTQYGVEDCLPLHLGAGFDLGCTLAADIIGCGLEGIRGYVMGECDGSGLFRDRAQFLRYEDCNEGPARLRAILLDLGRE